MFDLNEMRMFLETANGNLEISKWKITNDDLQPKDFADLDSNNEQKNGDFTLALLRVWHK